LTSVGWSTMSLIKVVMACVIASVLAFCCSIEEDPCSELNIATTVRRDGRCSVGRAAYWRSLSVEVMVESCVDVGWFECGGCVLDPASGEASSLGMGSWQTEKPVSDCSVSVLSIICRVCCLSAT
jgi:hypothetical protein